MAGAARRWIERFHFRIQIHCVIEERCTVMHLPLPTAEAAKQKLRRFPVETAELLFHICPLGRPVTGGGLWKLRVMESLLRAGSVRKVSGWPVPEQHYR